MCSSTTSIETSVLGYSTEEKCWQLWNLDDAGRAELPLGQNDSLTYPIGVALDTTSQKPYSHAGMKNQLFRLFFDAIIVFIYGTNFSTAANAFNAVQRWISMSVLHYQHEKRCAEFL